MQLSQFVKDAVKIFFVSFSTNLFFPVVFICSHEHEENVSYSSNEQRRFLESRSLTSGKQTFFSSKGVGSMPQHPLLVLTLKLTLVLSLVQRLSGSPWNTMMRKQTCWRSPLIERGCLTRQMYCALRNDLFPLISWAYSHSFHLGKS